jgi:hypothetical protein
MSMDPFSVFGPRINAAAANSSIDWLSVDRSARCFRRVWVQTHHLPQSILLPTTRKGRGPPKNEPHLRHTVSLRHSLNQSVHLLQPGPSHRHFPHEGSSLRPQGRDLIGQTLPHHHHLPPSPTLLRQRCHNNAVLAGLRKS